MKKLESGKGRKVERGEGRCQKEPKGRGRDEVFRDQAMAQLGSCHLKSKENLREERSPISSPQ